MNYFVRLYFIYVFGNKLTSLTTPLQSRPAGQEAIPIQIQIDVAGDHRLRSARR